MNKYQRIKYKDNTYNPISTTHMTQISNNTVLTVDFTMGPFIESQCNCYKIAVFLSEMPVVAPDGGLWGWLAVIGGLGVSLLVSLCHLNFIFGC